jgi:hypothetical protein
MEGFLQNRDEVGRENVKFILGTPIGPSGAPGSPFGRSTASAGPVHSDSKSGQPGHKARLESIVEQGRVVKIVVTCACGEVTEIDCDYSGE